MITTVTLNPAVDRTLFVESLKENCVNRVSAVKVWPGGKGINASKVIRLLGSEVTATGLLAAGSGKFFEETLNELGITTNFFPISGDARVNIKIYDTLKGCTTDLNEAGAYLDFRFSELFTDHIKTLASKSRVITFSGSIPAGVPEDFYLTLINIANHKGCRTILDSSGVFLKKGLKAKPYAVKPNKHELEGFCGKMLTTQAEIIECSMELIQMGIGMVLVSMGAEGALLVERERAFYAENIPVEVNGTVGAGDSMVGALAHAFNKGDDSREAFKLAMACSSACVYAGSTNEMDRAMIDRFMDKVKLREIPIGKS